MMPTQNDRTPPDVPLLEYRPRGAHPAPRIGPDQWTEASMALGVMSWLSMLLLCAGGRWPIVPIGLASAGLAAGIVAAVQPVRREAVGGALFGIFLSFTVLATWLLVLVLF